MKRETLQFAKQEGEKKEKQYKSIKLFEKRGKRMLLDGTPSLELASPVGWAGLAAACLIECASWQLNELGTNSLYKYACCRCRHVTHPSGPAELPELPWVLSGPIADTTCLQQVVIRLQLA